MGHNKTFSKTILTPIHIHLPANAFPRTTTHIHPHTYTHKHTNIYNHIFSIILLKFYSFDLCTENSTFTFSHHIEKMNC